MRVIVLFKATEDSEQGVMPKSDLLIAMGKYNEELVNAGIMLAGDGLHPSSKAMRVAFDGPGCTVIEGPFAETKDLVAGFWMWEVKDMAEAVEWVKRCPNPTPGYSEIEIPPLLREVGLRGSVPPSPLALGRPLPLSLGRGGDRTPQ